jgi:hypothetical protein
MSDRAMRLAMRLGLTPIVVAIAFLAARIWDTAGLPDRSIDAAMATAGTVIVCAFTLWIWRHYVRWNRLRSLSTAGLTLFVLAQVIAWHPIWATTDCSVQLVLCWGQSGTSAGAWCMACGLLWWSAVLLGRNHRDLDGSKREKRTMTTDAARLAIGMGMLPFLPGVFFLTMGTLEAFGYSADKTVGWACYQVCAILAGGIWLALWRRRVEWTRRRRRLTLVLITALLAVPFAAFAASPWSGLNRPLGTWGRTLEVFVQVLPLLVLGLWLGGSAWVWRNDSLERTLAPADAPMDVEAVARCPKCDYSLIGLHEVRCPECGWTATLDEVVRRSLAAWLDTHTAGV